MRTTNIFILLFLCLLKLMIGSHELRYNKAHRGIQESIFFSFFFLFQFAISIFEFNVRSILFCENSLSYTSYCFSLGIFLLITGLIIRFFGIKAAKEAINEFVNENKEKKRIYMISNGINRYLRHPVYLGTLIYTVGNEILLQNFISCILTFAVSWKYFYDNITDEERDLVATYGNDYITYRSATPTLIPFID